MAEIMIAFVLAVLIGISGVAAAKFADPPSIHNSPKASAMFLLGDSSVDCGENTLFYPLIHGNFSLLPCDGSDSTLLPHLLGTIPISFPPIFFPDFMIPPFSWILILFPPILAEKIGLPNSSTFYSQNGSIEALLNGVNFGSAKATIMNPIISNYQSLNQQIRQVFETIQLLQLQLGQNIASDFIQSSIFYLSFGKDDYTELYLVRGSSSSMCIEESWSLFRTRKSTVSSESVPCCGVGLIGCLSKQMACGSPSSRVWWDLYSPTGAVNSLLADSVWLSEPLSSICRPGTIQDLVYP